MDELLVIPSLGATSLLLKLRPWKFQTQLPLPTTGYRLRAQPSRQIFITVIAFPFLRKLLRSLRSELDQTTPGRGRDGFGAADNVEFGENAADVRLHGAVADK